MDIQVNYDPLPFGKDFHASASPFRLIVGGKGSGKTVAMLHEAFMLSTEYPKNTGLLARATYGELQEVVIDPLLDLLPPELIKEYRKADRKMEKAIVNGIELGYIKAPKDTFIEPGEVNQFQPHELLIMCTGSQGEPMAALSRISNGMHRFVTLQMGDTVVFSSNAIPGNTHGVNQLINRISEAGAKVIYGKMNNVHTSGHGGQQEQKLMLRLIKPKYFMPVHGEYRMLKIHSGLAQDTGVLKENCFIFEMVMSRSEER